MKYSTIEYQDEIFNTYHAKVMLESNCLALVHDVSFMTLIILNLNFSFKFLDFIIQLSSLPTILRENDQFNVILLCFRQSFDNHLLKITTCIPTSTALRNM